MKKIIWIFAAVLITQTACDLQPKIQTLPDSVGDFISSRYPALLADPNENPEIYNSAAMDYGVYASPELYGHDESDDYVMYASVDDYIIPGQVNEYGMPPQVDVGEQIVKAEKVEQENTDDYLVVPMYGAVKSKPEKKEVKKDAVESDDVLTVKKPGTAIKSVKKVELKDVIVASGDTLYSLSRKYSVPVNDLAVMNNLRAPFNLTVGQKLRVPNLDNVSENSVVEMTKKSQKTSVKEEKKIVKTASEKKAVSVKETQKKVVTSDKKISSDPSKKLPRIVARSSSKFSWPVRGKVLSAYGAKSNGLFNDGINISASRGTAVRSAENGVVAYAGNEIKGMGNLVIVQHSDGWMTVYAHMDTMSVRRGARVKVGDKIGTVGQTGKVDSPQLHFEIRKGTKAYNPSSYLKN